jgi:hypothetical protein
VAAEKAARVARADAQASRRQSAKALLANAAAIGPKATAGVGVGSDEGSDEGEGGSLDPASYWERELGGVCAPPPEAPEAVASNAGGGRAGSLGESNGKGNGDGSGDGRPGGFRGEGNGGGDGGDDDGGGGSDDDDDAREWYTFGLVDILQRHTRKRAEGSGKGFATSTAAGAGGAIGGAAHADANGVAVFPSAAGGGAAGETPAVNPALYAGRLVAFFERHTA